VSTLNQIATLNRCRCRSIPLSLPFHTAVLAAPTCYLSRYFLLLILLSKMDINRWNKINKKDQFFFEFGMLLDELNKLSSLMVLALADVGF
jgi:hypothetical protein